MQIGKISKEERNMVMLLRQIRAEWPDKKVIMVLEDEYNDERLWASEMQYEGRLKQEVIERMIKGESPCKWCEELNDGSCKGGEFGCSKWWLRFLTDAEKKFVRERVGLDHEVVEKEIAEAIAGERGDAGGGGLN